MGQKRVQIEFFSICTRFLPDSGAFVLTNRPNRTET